MRLTVVGCSGSLRRARLARRPATSSQAEHEGRTWRIAARPRQRRARGRCSGTSTRATSTPSSSATCTPTTASTCAASTSPSGTDPRGASRAGRRSTARRGTGDADRADAYGLDDGTAWTPSSTSASCDDRVPVDGRPVHGHAVPGQPPGRGLRPAGRGRRRRLAYTGDTDSCEASRRCARTPTWSSRTRPSSTAATRAAGIHLTGSRAARAAAEAGGVGG